MSGHFIEEKKRIIVNGVELEVSNTGNVFIVNNPKSKHKNRKSYQPLFHKGNRHGYKDFHCGGKTMYLHRIVAMAFMDNFNKDLTVDHIDGNPANNHISNLRQLSIADNIRAYNKPKKSGTSKYRGVCWSKDRRKWEVCVKKNRKKYYAGRFDSETDAALAYNNKALELGFLQESLNKI